MSELGPTLTSSDRTGLDAHTLARSLRRMAGDGSVEWVMEPIQASVLLDIADMLAENAKLREQIERLQPKDCEGNALDIADTVNMLRSEYDGDHEWDDVVVEIALTKWGGDRWIVRGSKGEAWACDCTKTGYDEDAYEGSDDVEPIDNPTLAEAENDKLRKLVKSAWRCIHVVASCSDCRLIAGGCTLQSAMLELGVEAE